jgi:hypothetical protein
LYFVLHPHGLNMKGRWVGLGYDDKIMTGWGSMARTHDDAEAVSAQLNREHVGIGLAVVWLLWRPASRAFFRPPGYTQAQHQAQMAEFDHEAQVAELAQFRGRLPRV